MTTVNASSNALVTQCQPEFVIASLTAALREVGVLVDHDSIAHDKAYLSAAGLLLAFGIEPLADPADASSAAETVRCLVVEQRTRTTTRKRRAL